MAASAAIPKDLPREAEVNVDERQRLNHTAAEHTSSSDDDEDEDEEDEGDEHEELHGHSHAHGGGGHQHSHGHSHAHYDDDEHRPHVRFSETPAGGLLLHILQSIPLVTSVLLRLLPATNAIAGLLALFHLLGPSTHSACSVSLLPPSGAADYGRVLLSLLFDDSYASCLASLFAVYELGSRLETLKSSFHFLLLTLTYLLATAAAYYLLLLYVPALLAFPCSVGFWPVVIALAVTESLHNPLEPRSFPLFPYAIPPLSYPLLLLLAQQLLFAIHPFPIVALPLAYVLHFPLRVVVRGLSVALERSGGVAWLGGRDGYIAVGKAGTMPPWAPIHLVSVRPTQRPSGSDVR